MRVAFVSDVHGNLPALEGVLAELARRGPFDTTVGGGDYVFGGAYPGECLAEIRRSGWPCVRGNTDEWVVEAATNGSVPAQGYEPEQAHTAALRAVDAWAADRLDDDDIAFLESLPLDWRATGPSGQTLAFVHATPWSTHPVVMPDADEATAQRMLDAAGTDVLLYGHIHIAYVRRVGAHTLACVGSVGMPFDGDPRSCFLIATDEGGGWQLEHVRVPYDRDAYVATLLASGLPNAELFASMLRSASSGR
jgi:predicted phosphodiesterase